MDSPLNMWSYWLDKHGEEIALAHFYPDRVANDVELRDALRQIRTAKAFIREKMGNLALKEGE